MNNNKQTAVDYIDEAIDKYLAYSVEGSHNAEPFTITDLREAVQQAKEMEKQQIVKAWDDADYAYFSSKETGIDFENGKEYYNEEYGGNNEQQ